MMRRLLNLMGVGLIAFGLLWAAAMLPFWRSVGAMVPPAPASPAVISFAAILAGWVLMAAAREW